MLREGESELSRLFDEAGELPVNERGEAVVKRLMSMYPHHAADILKRSDDVPFRLKVSALMARTLLEALASGARHDKDNGARLVELHVILSTSDQAALGSVVVRTCYRMTKQPMRSCPIVGPLLFRKFLAFNGVGLSSPAAWDAKVLLEELLERLRELFADEVFATYLALIHGGGAGGMPSTGPATRCGRTEGPLGH